MTDENEDFKFIGIEVLPIRAVVEDIRNLRYLEEQGEEILPGIIFIVKIRLKGELPYTARSVELYLDEYFIRKYNEYKDGVFFKVFNPRFFKKHSSKRLAYSMDGVRKVDTGLQFPDLSTKEKINKLVALYPKLPTFEEVLC